MSSIDEYGKVSYDYIADLFNDHESEDNIADQDYEIPEDLRQMILNFEDEKESFIKQLKADEDKELNTILTPWVFSEEIEKHEIVPLTLDMPKQVSSEEGSTWD